MYDVEADPYEWVNLAANSEHAERIARLRAHAPTEFATYVPASEAALPELKWHSADDSTTPASQPHGDPFHLVFTNNRNEPVNVYGIDQCGKRKPFGTLQAGWRGKPYKTQPGAVFLITDTDENALGHFVVGDRAAHAIIPAR